MLYEVITRMEIGFSALSITLVDVVVFLPILFLQVFVADMLKQFDCIYTGIIRGKDVEKIYDSIRVITSYSIHYTKLYEKLVARMRLSNDNGRIVIMLTVPARP